jgi:hypothetical protein
VATLSVIGIKTLHRPEHLDSLAAICDVKCDPPLLFLRAEIFEIVLFPCRRSLICFIYLFRLPCQGLPALLPTLEASLGVDS